MIVILLTRYNYYYESFHFLLSCLTWKDLIKVHRRFLIPSERLSSLMRRSTRNSRKNVMETLTFSAS